MILVCVHINGLDREIVPANFKHIIFACPFGKTDFKSLCSFQGECDSSFGARFTYSIFSEEVIVGEIFVRIYNDQPLFPLEVGISKFVTLCRAVICFSFLVWNNLAIVLNNFETRLVIDCHWLHLLVH